MEKIVLVGAGGHCKVIIDILKSMQQYEIVGILDNENKSRNLLDVPIIGNDDLLNELYLKGVKNAFICIGALNNINVRNNIYHNLKKIGFKLPILIHKNSIVSEYAKLGEGTCVMPGAIINAGSIIKENCIINTGSIIEHDCLISSNCHISPNVTLGGQTIIEYNCHIGIGSIIIQGVNVGKNVTIGAGAVVVNNIEENSIAVGIPARVLRKKI
ncbi:acetyltransferase [Clostridium tetani]|uniref:acetyltransferase n=1 Tax=Clostridium tetani TaxID=1513 RepID=UPI00100A2788|nr:acetyltransferase [Clostridium tetani]RXM69159.1 serine acetyltransferase [Clostridium tetani]